MRTVANIRSFETREQAEAQSQLPVTFNPHIQMWVARWNSPVTWASPYSKYELVDLNGRKYLCRIEYTIALEAIVEGDAFE